MSRYSRQLLLPQIGPAGQERLRAGRALLVGCGALGTVIAEQLCRAGVGFIRIADRDVVEISNLQRQTLFDERDANDATPKAVAAGNRLRAINTKVSVEPHVIDVGPDNIESLVHDVDIILDGTDNVATRYLINDVAVKLAKPWVYGACVGVEGRVMPIARGRACLRCIFPEPAAAGELPTCDTVGVLASVAGIVASWQVIAALRFLMNDAPPPQMLTIDAWSQRMRSIDISDARRAECVCCGLNDYEFLNRSADRGASLCGRDAVQVRAPVGTRLNLGQLSQRLARVARTEQTPYLLRVMLKDSSAKLTVFADGRAIVHGTDDVARARVIYDQVVGA